MPFHFQFNPKEQLRKDFDIQRLKFTSEDLDSFTVAKFESLNLDMIRLLRNSVFNSIKFDFFLETLLAPDGDFPDFYQSRSLFDDYDNWRNTNINVDFSKDPAYFAISRSVLETFINNKLSGKELIVKFGCTGSSIDGKIGSGSNNFSNLSIFIAGMTMYDYSFHSLTDYIECDSMITSPTGSKLIDSNFRGKTANFSGRAMGEDITKIGVSHNLNRKTTPAGKIEYGFLSDFLRVNPTATTFYIHPTYDPNHQGGLTVIFSPETDLRNIPPNQWDLNKVYNFGQGCCPPQ